MEIGHILNSSVIIFISSAAEFYSFWLISCSVSWNTANISLGVLFKTNSFLIVSWKYRAYMNTILQKQSLKLIQLCWSYIIDEFQFLDWHQLITQNHFESNVFWLIKACIFYFQSTWSKGSPKCCSCMTFWPTAAPWRKRMWRKKYFLLNWPWQLCFLIGKKKHSRDETMHERWRTSAF